MAKLVILFVAAIALQGVFGGINDQPDQYVEETPRDVVTDIETHTKELVAWITTTKDVEQLKTMLHHYREGVELITKKLAGKSALPDADINDVLHELTNKFRSLLMHLQDPTSNELTKTMIEICSRLARLCEYVKTGTQPIEAHQFLRDIIVEYNYVLGKVHQDLKAMYQNENETGKMQESTNAQMEYSLMEIVDNLKLVQFDNASIRRTITNLIREYTHELEVTLQRFDNIHGPAAGYTRMPETIQEAVTLFKSFLSTDTNDSMTSKQELTMGFEKLANAIKNWEGKHVDTMTKSHLMHLLTATRNLEFNIYSMCSTVVPHGETTTHFGLQIETVANGIINTLQTIILDSDESKRIILDQTRELVQNLESVLKKIHGLTYTSSKVVETVTMKLAEVITSLKNILESVAEMKTETIKTRLIDNVREATMAIEKLLWVEREAKHGGENVKGNLYEIFNDFVAVLQHQLLQLQNAYQGTSHKQPASHLTTQIQAITNGIVVYLRNVPTNGVMIREKLEVQVHHLVKKLQAAINRVGAIDNPEFTKILQRLMEITVSFEDLMEKTKISSIKEVVFHFNILVQSIASEMKKLAWTVSNPTDSLKNDVNSLLSEYVVIIENIQIKIQRINQVGQAGETPYELALQIEVIADHLRKMLVAFVSENSLTKQVFTWQTRRFNQIMEVIVDQLFAKLTSDSGKLYKEVATKLKETQIAYKACMDDMEKMNIYQVRIKIGGLIMKAAMEIQKLTWIAQSDIQEGQGIETTFVRSMLLEFLLGLQDFHVQMQHNFQVVLSGVTPRTLLMKIQLMSKRIFERLQMLTSNYGQFEEIMTIQLGEYSQTLENTLNLLHQQMKNSGEHKVEIEKIADILGKISLVLQNVNMKDSNDVISKLEMSLHAFMTGMHSLAMMSRAKVTETQVGAHTGILHALLSNMLATLRNMYVQMQYFPHDNEHGEISLGQHMTTINNNIMPALETIVGSTTPVKQALDVQMFKYARNLKQIVEYLEKFEMTDLTEVKTNLREALMLLEQTASSVTTLTINELKLHFNNIIQGVGAEMQMLIHIQSTGKDNQGFIRTVLIKYLTILKNLHIQIQNVSRMSRQSENYQLVGMEIDTAIIELCKSLQVVPKDRALLAKAVVIQSHELAQLILNIINRYQAGAVLRKNSHFMDIATQLKNVQLVLQDMTVEKTLAGFNDVVLQLAANVEHAAELIEELMWLPTVEEMHQTQYRPDVATFVRVTLHDFLIAVQNMVIQIENVLVYADDKNLVLMEHLSSASMNEKVKQGMQMHLRKNSGEETLPISNILYHPEMELFNGMRGKAMIGETHPVKEDWMMKMMPNYMKQMPRMEEHNRNYPSTMQYSNAKNMPQSMKMYGNMDMNEMQVPNKHYADIKMMPKYVRYTSPVMRTYSQMNEMERPSNYYSQRSMMPNYYLQMSTNEMEMPNKYYSDMKMMTKSAPQTLPQWTTYNNMEMNAMEVPNKYYGQIPMMPQYEDMRNSPSMRMYGNAKTVPNMSKMSYSQMNSNVQQYAYSSPKSVAMNIDTVTKEILQAFETKSLNPQQMIYHIRQFVKIINEIVQKLKVVEIADNLTNLKLALENIIKREPSMNAYQMTTEVCKNFELISEELQKLVNVHEYRTAMLVNNVLEPYLVQIQKINQDLRSYPMGSQHNLNNMDKFAPPSVVKELNY